MTTRFDIQDAKADYIEHVGQHHCRIGDGCSERIRLWKVWVGSKDSVAARWGLDYGDTTKAERQFWERYPNASKLVG